MIKGGKSFGVQIISDTLKLFTQKDKNKLLAIIIINTSLAILDLIGVVAIGLLGTLTLSGVSSTTPSSSIISILTLFSLDNLELTNQKIVGNKTQEIREFLSRNKGSVRIELNDIKAVLMSKGLQIPDTITLKPLLYCTKVNATENLFNEENNGFKSSPLSEDSKLIVYNNIGNYKVLKQIVQGDTLLLVKRRDSSNRVVFFERYYIDKLNHLKMQVLRISDTSYSLSYFNAKGICIA